MRGRGKRSLWSGRLGALPRSQPARRSVRSQGKSPTTAPAPASDHSTRARGGVGSERRCDSTSLELFEGRRDSGCKQDCAEFTSDGFTRDSCERFADRHQRSFQLRVELQAPGSRHSHRPQPPQGILQQALFCPAHRAQQTVFEVAPTAEGIDEFTALERERHGVDGEIPLSEIFLHPHPDPVAKGSEVHRAGCRGDHHCLPLAVDQYAFGKQSRDDFEWRVRR